MPRKRVVRSPPEERRSDGDDDDDFFFDDSQSSSGRNSHEPVHRNAANARERARMRVLSKAFCRLKTTLPWVPADTKLSKLDTLRLAASYIAHLRALLQDEPRAASQMFPHPLNLAWPFAFQHGGSLSCSISPRWTTSQTDSAGHRAQDPALRDTHYNSAQHYSHESDYEKRCNELDNTVSNQTAATGNTVQYCNYSHKETYYEMRNSYSSDSVMMHESC